MATVLILGRDYAAAMHEQQRTQRAVQAAREAFEKADVAAGAALKKLDQAIKAQLDATDG